MVSYNPVRRNYEEAWVSMKLFVGCQPANLFAKDPVWDDALWKYLADFIVVNLNNHCTFDGNIDLTGAASYFDNS